jgi:hypothetical protein
MALQLGRPRLQLKSQLRFTGQIVGGRNIAVTTLNGVATVSSVGGVAGPGLAKNVAGQIAVFTDSSDIDGVGIQAVAFLTSAVEYTMDGGGGPIGTGYKGLIEVPFACRIIAVKLFADTPGNLTMDIRKKTYAGLPFVGGDSIIAADPPTLAAAQFSTDVALTGWTTAINANDLLGFYVTGTPTVNVATVSLLVTRI